MTNSFFLFSYLIVWFLGIIAGVIATAQWMIGSYQWGMWAAGGALGLIAVLYLVAQTGQKLGAQQMFLLHQTYEAAMGAPIEVH